MFVTSEAICRFIIHPSCQVDGVERGLARRRDCVTIARRLNRSDTSETSSAPPRLQRAQVPAATVRYVVCVGQPTGGLCMRLLTDEGNEHARE